MKFIMSFGESFQRFISLTVQKAVLWCAQDYFFHEVHFFRSILEINLVTITVSLALILDESSMMSDAGGLCFVQALCDDISLHIRDN